MDPVISLLRELVAIDSVNPALVPGAAGEGAIAGAIAAHLRRIGLEVELQDAAPGRPNVIGVLEGRRKGRSLMFCGHVDTVGVEGMDAPFDPVVRDGRVYGRGSQDMKGGVAAMIDAARVIASEGLDSGRLIVAAVVDEEFESIGADALVTRWRADAGVVTEPTDLQIAIGHKGFCWVEVETRGRAAHGSRPKDGRDAILRMGRVLHELEQLDRRLQSGPAHPLMGAASLHASLINGGRELSSYPDRCALTLERRTIPGEDDRTVTNELETILARLRDADPEFDATFARTFSRPPYALPPDHALPRALLEARGPLPDRRAQPGPLPDTRAQPGPLPDTRAQPGPLPDTRAQLAPLPDGRAERANQFVGMSFWTDAAVLGSAGIPSVLFGPGGAGLHSVEEYVEIQDVLRCRDALAALARAW